MADVSVLNVNLYGEPIGTLTRLPNDKNIFAFNEAYIADLDRPILGLGFKDNVGELLTDFRSYHMKVMPFFSNLLPEDRLRTYLAERAGVHPEREYFLLWVLGTDLPGAVTVTPADGEAWPSDVEDDIDEAFIGEQKERALRFSLAGVQLKFSAVSDATGGLTIPARGIGGDWIVKLPSQKYNGIPENEFAMMTLARQLGMDVPAVELVDIADIANLPEDVAALKGRALAIERFDRLSDGTAVHTEDFAQVFGLYASDKYKKASMMNIASVLAIETDENDVREFVRRLVFNTLIGNADMHLKNWSLIYPDRHNPHLAPAYDFVSTIPYLPDDKAALKVSHSASFNDFTEAELASLADRSSLPKAVVLDQTYETIQLFHEHWATAKQELTIDAEVAKAIDVHLKAIPIA